MIYGHHRHNKKGIFAMGNVLISMEDDVATKMNELREEQTDVQVNVWFDFLTRFKLPMIERRPRFAGIVR